ncbi:MAG: hypothetical protein RLZZ628_2028 [Bacteroidota bacterium]|jgi:hypothetical protein
MACTGCKKKKGGNIGSLSANDKKELVEGAWIAAGAVGSKMLVNPLVKAIFGAKETKNSPGIVKLGIAAALWYADTDESRAMAKGAGAVGILDLLDKNYPTIFQGFLPKGNAAPADNPGLPAPAATNGIRGGVILDLDHVQGHGVGYAYSPEERASGRGLVLNR